MTHGVNHFDGLAAIADPQAAATAVLNGIGKGRSYGAGLLSLAPFPKPACSGSGALGGAPPHRRHWTQGEQPLPTRTAPVRNARAGAVR